MTRLAWLIDRLLTALGLRPAPCDHHFWPTATGHRPKLFPVRCSPRRLDWGLATHPGYGCAWCGRYFRREGTT